LTLPDCITRVECTDPQALGERLALDTASNLRQAMEKRGSACLLVSGGSTPIPFLQALSAEDIDWARVSVALVDERWVTRNHEDSNERLVRENLLVDKASKARFISCFSDLGEIDGTGGVNNDKATTAVDALPGYARKMHSLLLAHAGAFDVTVLGMGNDGHTASLFPYSSVSHSGRELPDHLHIACTETNAPKSQLSDTVNVDLSVSELVTQVRPSSAPHERLSLTYSGIFKSRMLMLHIVGQEKCEVLSRALQLDDHAAFPIAAVFRYADPVVYWCDD